MIGPFALVVSLVAPPDHWFGPDKIKHFFVAAFTQSVAYTVLQTARVRHDQALAGATVVTAVVSVGKELRDRRKSGLFSVRDLVWDAAGAAAASALLDHSRRSGSTVVEEPKPSASPARVAWPRRADPAGFRGTPMGGFLSARSEH